MDNDDKKGQVVPANMEEAVAEFMRARQERIAIRRARIADKIAQAKNKEGPGHGETASIPSSLEFLTGLGDKSSPDSHPETAFTKKRKSHLAKEKKDEKKISSAAEQLDLQIEESRKQLEQMIIDGEILITNVKVAAEYREKVRQHEHDESYRERLERLRQEAEECQNMYGALSENWAINAEKILPMDLYKQMRAQQTSCDELLGKKDDMITSMRRQIEENDFAYETNLENYQKDGMLMGDRIDDLVDELRIAFVEELNLIEDYTCRNRETILEDNQHEWMELLQQFESMEQKNLEERKTEAVAKFQTLNDLFTTTKQEARGLRHKMEDDLRILIQEREQIKYACQLNLEKMGYNLHILQCRSKENVELKNMMKRFLLQLHDKFDSRAASLKKKMEIGKRQCDKLIKDIERLETQVSTFGNKTLHLALSDHRKYMDLWIANEEIVRDKVKTLLDSEKFVYETQLGMEFQLPDMLCFDNRPNEVKKTLMKQDPDKKVFKNKKGPVKKVRQKVSSLELNDDDEMETVKSEGLESTSEPLGECGVGKTNASLLILPSDSLQFLPGPDPDPVVQRRLMKSIAKVICDQSGFIVEEELQKILNPLLETEKNLVNLDAVLQSLGITNVEEMQTLARYMLKNCKVMKGVMSKMGSEVSAHMSEMNVSMDGVVGKAAMEELSDSVSSSSSDLLTSIAESQQSENCGGDPSTFCECMAAQLQKAEISRQQNAHIHTHGHHHHTHEIMDSSNKDEDIMPLPSPPMHCSPVCCSPPDTPLGSVEKILQDFETDGELEMILNKVESPEDENETQADEDNGPDASFFSNRASVLSWLDDVDRENILQNLRQYKEILGEDDDYYEEIDGNEGMLQPPRPSSVEEEEQEDVEQSIKSVSDGDQKGSETGEASSKTISIPSHDSSSDASDEFVYIQPEDVITALKNFCEDYKNRQHVVLPTAEEIISRKLAKIKYPVQLDVSEYWENAINLLEPKGKDLWDTVQYCFEQYNQVLKERNNHVTDITKLYKQNYELSHLLQRHLQAGAQHSSKGSGNQMGYC